MSRLVLDTSAYSHFKRGTADAVDALAHASWVGVPVVVLAAVAAQAGAPVLTYDAHFQKIQRIGVRHLAARP